MAAGYPGFSADGRHPCARDSALAAATRGLLANSLAPASRRSYAVGQESYLDFCRQFSLQPVPASDETLAYFVGHMRRRGMAIATARQYLAAVRRLHLQWGQPLPPGLPPYTDAAIRGYPQRLVQSPTRPRHALTVERLCILKNRLPLVVPTIWDQRCIWAACTVAFFAGLRGGEYLDTGPGRGLRRCDIDVTPVSCGVRLGVQKTQQSGSPPCIALPATGTDTCPVRGLSQYVAARDASFAATAPLFLLQDGSALSRPTLNATLRAALGPGFSSHSLRTASPRRPVRLALKTASYSGSAGGPATGVRRLRAQPAAGSQPGPQTGRSSRRPPPSPARHRRRSPTKITDGRE